MLTIALTLVAGRYHATPWGHHANEGQVEWPPTPWRLARALASVAYQRRPDGPGQTTRDLLVRLASTPPQFRLPPATVAHLRHYMPLAAADKKRGVEKTTKVLDAFAAVDRHSDATILVHWPDLELTDADRADLEELCTALGYLGRAESWVDARVVEQPPDRIDAHPVEGGAAAGAVPVALLASEADFGAWLAGLKRGGRPPKGTPQSRWDALTIDSLVLHAQKWSKAPGLRAQAYTVTRRLVPPPPRRRPVPADRPRVAVYALHNRVLPRIEDALVLGELTHRALVARSDGLPIFTGRNADETPMKGHRHARYLPLSRGGRGVDTLLVTCRDGFDPEAVAALTGLTSLPRTDGRGSRDDGDRWALTLVGLGTPGDFAHAHDRAGQVGLVALASGTEWVTATPFVAPRHPKKRRGEVVRDGVLDQVWRAWERHLARLAEDTGEPAPTVLDVDFDGLRREGLRWAGRFQRERRRGGGCRGPGHGHALRVRLSAPITGPVSLGYAAHFGLGVFIPVG